MNFVQKMASHLTLSNDLSPDDRDREYKGRIKQCFSAFGYKPIPAVLASLFGALFMAPFIVLFYFLLNKDVNAIIESAKVYNEMGLLIGASTQAELNVFIDQIFDLKQKYVLIYLIPCCLLAGVGMSGVHNVMRNVLWNTNPRFFRDFFVGIKRHWYKFVVSWLVMGVVALGFVFSLLEVMQAAHTHVACSPWYWVLLIFSGIVGLIMFMYFMVLQPMFVTYKYDKKPLVNIKCTLKNAGILALLSPIQLLFIVVLLAAPFLLCIFTQFGTIFLVLFACGGVSFYVLLSIQYSQFLSDNFIYYLYSREQKMATKSERKKEKKEKKAKKKNKK